MKYKKAILELEQQLGLDNFAIIKEVNLLKLLPQTLTTKKKIQTLQQKLDNKQ